MTGDHSLEAIQERAALYAVGALRGDDARQFEAHLSGGCDACAAEVNAFAAAAAHLADAAGPAHPSPSVRERVMERIVAPDLVLLDQAGVRIVRSAGLAWRPGRASAVEVKVLHVDAERGYATKLVRMAPGAALIPHRHADLEESYILEGDLLVAGVEMRAGDYCRAESGSVHDDIRTRGGCVFIAVQSQRDEWLSQNR